MKRKIASICLLAVASVFAACGGDEGNTNAGNGNATRNGVVDTNANTPKSGNTAPSNTAVVTNNNGNDNTAGVKTTNTANANNGNKANANTSNANKKP